MWLQPLRLPEGAFSAEEKTQCDVSARGTEFILCSSSSLTTGGSHVLLELHDQLSYEYTTMKIAQHPPAAPHTYMHIHAEEPTH